MITCAHVGMHTSMFTCAIYCTCKIIAFSLFVLLLLYISQKDKFFIEGFLIENYIQEIENVINCKIL